MASAQLLITRLVFDITSFSQGARIDFIAQIGGASIGWGCVLVLRQSLCITVGRFSADPSVCLRSYFEYLNRGLLLGTTPDFSWFTG